MPAATPHRPDRDAPLGRPVRLVDDSIDAASVGHKFARLAAAHATVPDAFCLPTGWFVEALGYDRRRRLDELISGLAVTLGNDAAALPVALARIMDGLTLNTAMRRELANIVAALGHDRPVPGFAVRSSATTEDGAEHSHAGLYDSFLHLTADDVEDAVLACWRSYYSARAVLGRIRAGHHDTAPEMAVIIQQMADAHLAGVAFTQDDHTIIDSTAGTGDALVAGLVDAHRTQVGPTAGATTPFRQVADLAQTLRRNLDTEVDIEWAWTGTDLALLQVRPVTAGLGLPTRPGPVFDHARLYLDDTLPPDLLLGDCAEIYFSYRNKRAPLYRLAAEHGIATGRGWVISVNGAALADPTQHPDWWPTLGEQVVLDLGPTLRQHILPTTQLAGFLTEALNLTGDPYRAHTVILRDFVQGAAGIITRRLPDGATVVEHAAQGLLAINRGLTEPDRLTLPPPDDSAAWQHITPPPGWHPSALHQLASFTTVLHGQAPGALAEWVLHDEHPLFVDHSQPATPSPAPQTATADSGTPTTAATRTVSISPGTARGPLLQLNDSEELTRLSVAPIISVTFRADTPESPYITDLLAQITALPQKPIIHARRPYAILSLLIDHAAGFVFTGGSTLCHLAILLREAQLPSLIAPDLNTDGASKLATISNDAVHLTPFTPTRSQLSVAAANQGHGR